MPFPFDQPPEDDDHGPTEDELRAEAAGKTPTEFLKGAQRSSADDVLDLIGGVKRPKVNDLRFCPVCKSPTKVRGNTVQGGTMSRRCVNPKCKNEYPIVTHRAGVDIPPAPPDPMLQGPYRVGSSRIGVYAHGIDPDQPISRRIAEFGRRVNQEE